MAQVTHAGRPVIDESQGGWVFIPAVKGRDIELIKLAKATKLRAKDLGVGGAPLRLIVDFCGTESQFNIFRGDIEGLYDGTIGDLNVPNAGSDYPDCIFIGTPQFSQQIAIEGNRSLYTVDMELMML